MKLLISTVVIMTFSFAAVGPGVWANSTAPAPFAEVVEKAKIYSPAAPGTLDVLWIVDNSGSMAQFQQKLADNADLIFGSFAGKSGWQMAMVSTDLDDIRGYGLSGDAITAATLLPEQRFADWVKLMGTVGAPTETPYSAASVALRDFPTFFRSGVPLAIVIVTDAPEQSMNVSLKINTQTLLAQIHRLKFRGEGISVFPVICAGDLGCQTGDDANDFKGSPYEEFIAATSGKVFSLHTFDAEQPKILGQSVSSVALAAPVLTGKIFPEFALANAADFATLRLEYDGKSLPQGPASTGGVWMYDFQRNSIYFHDLSFRKDGLDEVTIRYFVRPLP